MFPAFLGLGPDRTTFVEVKTLHGEVRHVPIATGLEYGHRWEERRLQWVEAKQKREENKRLKGGGRIWFGKHRGTLWAELDDVYVSIVGGSEDAAPEAAAEFKRRQEDPTSLLFDEDIYFASVGNAAEDNDEDLIAVTPNEDETDEFQDFWEQIINAQIAEEQASEQAEGG